MVRNEGQCKITYNHIPIFLYFSSCYCVRCIRFKQGYCKLCIQCLSCLIRHISRIVKPLSHLNRIGQTMINLVADYLNVNSILLLFIVLFVFIIIRQLTIGLSISFFRHVVIILTFVIGILLVYDKQVLAGILFLLLGIILAIGIHYKRRSKNENKE